MALTFDRLCCVAVHAEFPFLLKLHMSHVQKRSACSNCTPGFNVFMVIEPQVSLGFLVPSFDPH